MTRLRRSPFRSSRLVVGLLGLTVLLAGCFPFFPIFPTYLPGNNVPLGASRPEDKPVRTDVCTTPLVGSGPARTQAQPLVPDVPLQPGADSRGLPTIVVAGTGSDSYTGDGGPAVMAGIGSPRALACDTKGNIFVADSRNHCVRRIDAHGVITSVAGNGFPGRGVDGRLATESNLRSPEGLAVDKDGSLYIGDTGNRMVRKVLPNGTITTVVGKGMQEHDLNEPRAALTTGVGAPRGMLVDDTGTLFFLADGAVLRYQPAGHISSYYRDGGVVIYWLCRLSEAWRMNTPQALASDALGNLYIADTLNMLVRVARPDGQVGVVAGMKAGGINKDGVQATTAALSHPCSLAVDRRGWLYIGEWDAPRLRVVDGQGIIRSLLAYFDQTKPSPDPSVRLPLRATPAAIAFEPNGDLLIADPGGWILRVEREFL